MKRRNSSATHRPSRRRFLVGAGATLLGLPWLEKLEGVAHAQAAVGPKRIIVMTYPMGIPGGVWRPSAAGSNFTLPYVTAPLERFRSRCLFVSSIDNSMLSAGGNAFVHGHPGKSEAALTGTLTTGAFPTSNNNHLSEIRSGATTDGVANGPSIEQLIGQAKRTATHRLASLDLGVDGDAVRRSPAPTQASRFFFEGAGNAVSLQMHPHAAFARLFSGINSGPSEADRNQARLRRRNKSVLDAVRSSFNELKQGLGADDRRRLEEHAARIRSVELDPVVMTASCTAPAGIPTSDQYRGLRMNQLASLQIRIMAHAMACDMAPVGRLEFTNQQSPRFGITSLDNTLDAVSATFDWHGMVHGDPLPGTQAYLRPGRGTDTSYDARLQDGYRFFVQQFADLLAALDAVAEGPEGSVLDHSLVILASDLGEGLGHGHGKMGYILAGNLGGARRGFHLDATPQRPFEVTGSYFYAASRWNVNQLLNSVLDMAAVTTNGQPMTIGLGGYLESRSLPRRIDDLFA